jgi:methylated-DNA-protein-cysteine methyltransferase-like protein
MSFYDTVYSVVVKIPKGRVATYGQIAYLCGSPKASRAVGYALHFNPKPDVIPCFRVVDRFGHLAPAFAFGGIEEHARRLRADGVEISEDFFVDLNKYGWRPDLDIQYL